MRSSFNDGWSRVRRAPWVVVGVWLSTVALALPLAVALHGMLATHLGASLEAGPAVTGVNFDWWNEFLAQASGVGQSFVPAIIGFAAVLKNLSGVADAEGVPAAVVSVVAMQIAASMFLAGGVLDRLARDRAVGAGAFFSACGVYFFRFLRLGAMAAAAYGVLFGVLHPWLFGTVYPALIRDLTVERTAFAYRAVLYVAFALPVLAVNVVFDYAKIRAVVEDRRSMIGALAAGARFVARHPREVAGLYALNASLFAGVLAIYATVAPWASASLWAFAAGQVYIVLRVLVRLRFAASQTSYFQARLAHAGYVARPVPAWPDSPAAEAIKGL